MFVSDINLIKEAFVRKIDLTGRSFSRRIIQVQKLFNPFYPVAGKFNNFVVHINK